METNFFNKFFKKTSRSASPQFKIPCKLNTLSKTDTTLPDFELTAKNSSPLQKSLK